MSWSSCSLQPHKCIHQNPSQVQKWPSKVLRYPRKPWDSQPRPDPALAWQLLAMLCPSRDTGEVSRGAGECPGLTVVNQRMVSAPGPGRGMWRGKETSPLCPMQHSRLLLEDPPLLSLCFHLHGVAMMSGLEPLPSSPLEALSSRVPHPLAGESAGGMGYRAKDLQPREPDTSLPNTQGSTPGRKTAQKTPCKSPSFPEHKARFHSK